MPDNTVVYRRIQEVVMKSVGAVVWGRGEPWSIEDDEHIQRIDPSRFAEANECAFVRVHSPEPGRPIREKP
jgi:hypothetical protein